MNSEIIIECAVNYFLNDEGGQNIAQGEALARLNAEALAVLPKFGEVLLISLRDILAISASDYQICCKLTSDEKLILGGLGYQYEDFLRNLYLVQNELYLKDLLMQEALKKSGITVNLVFIDESGQEAARGAGELRLYETAVVVLPEQSGAIRIPYGTISEVKTDNYSLIIKTDFGEQLTCSQLGREFEPLVRRFSELQNELSLKVQSWLKEIAPEVVPSGIRKAAYLMKEGKAARKSELEAIAPEFWRALEKQVELLGIKAEYDFLKTLSQPQKICIGYKRGLMGDLTGEYLWFLIPIYSANPAEPGNAIVMEAVTRETGTEAEAGRDQNQKTSGKATYLFRIVGRRDYARSNNLEELHRETDAAIQNINRCMLAINFRREPIYLSTEKLEEPQYQKYRLAVSQIPALRNLRQLYIGRVIHNNPEQWQEDLLNLLKFNISTQDDQARWLKGEIEDRNCE